MAFFSKRTVVPPTDQVTATNALNVLKREAGKSRRTRMQKRIDYIDDKQEAYLEQAIKKQFKYPDRMNLQMEYYNLTDLIIDETAIIYNEEPGRELLDAKETDSEIYADIVKKSGLNQTMQQLNRYVKLCKTAAIRPVWRNGQIQYDLYTPNNYDVFQEITNPTQPRAFVWGNVIDLQNEINQNNDDTRGKRDPWDTRENIFYYMDALKFIVFSVQMTSGQIPIAILKMNENNEDNTNPYGILPFVTVRDGVAIDEYFLQGGDGLIQSNEIINVKITELNYLTKMQSFSVPVRKGADTSSDSLILDPSMTIDLPADDDAQRNADFKFVSPDAKIQDMETNIENKIKKTALKNNLSPDRFTTSGQKSSAEAMQIRAFDQSKILKRDKPFYAHAEQELFEKTKVVWNTHNPDNPISESATLLIDFRDVETPMTVEDRDNHNIVMFSNGLISKTDWLMSENPDIKDEKLAKEILTENLEEKKKEQAEFSDIPILKVTDDIGDDPEADT